MNAVLEDKLNRAVAEAVAKAREEERAVINNTLVEAGEATKAADAVKDKSLAELERIRKEQEEENKKLEDTLTNSRQKRKGFKERLANRKAKKLESISKQAEYATEEEKEEKLDAAEGDIIREEQEDLAQLHKELDEEEEMLRKEHESKLNAIEQKAAEDSDWQKLLRPRQR